MVISAGVLDGAADVEVLDVIVQAAQGAWGAQTSASSRWCMIEFPRNVANQSGLRCKVRDVGAEVSASEIRTASDVMSI